MLKIALCNKKTDRKYINQEQDWDYIATRNASPIRTTETAEEYAKMPKSKRDPLKDKGGFVGGWLKGGIRKNGNVICRQIGTLDADIIENNEEFIKALETELSSVKYFIYSTHSHTAAAPRYRVVIELDREVSEEEYPAVMRKVAQKIGMDYFDDTTYQANRMMYWASAPSNGEFYYKRNDAAPLNVDAVLASYQDWRDITQWPTSSRQSEVIQRDIKRQEDPLTKDGPVGAFCRVYSIEDVIETYLKDVYAPSSATEGRYDYIAGEGSAGVVIYDHKWAYSHHGTDPASCMLLNAFDLVRVHRFGELEPKASYSAMVDLAQKDEAVKDEMVRTQLAGAKVDFNSADAEEWLRGLELNKKGAIVDSFNNFILILKNDKALENIAFNELRDGIDARGPLPWKQIKPGWSENDQASLKEYLVNKYGLYAPSKTADALRAAAAVRSYHPIKEYLKALPEWDKIARLDTLLIDYFGAEDSTYTRAVTRKTLVAAVARIYRPGIKFDSVLILNGPQGIGKSTFFNKIAGKWFSDSLSLTDMKDKAGAEKLQGYWLLELGELAGMKKADVESVKSFITRPDDKYRPSYGQFVESHPRQCVIVGSTNSESGFLRDITGNRRFWPVKISGESVKHSWELTEEDVSQIWAEALVYYLRGEKLYLSGTVAEDAKEAQTEAVEVDEREGIILNYLDTLLPEGWEDFSLYDRRQYLTSGQDDLGTEIEGTEERTEVTNIEIWAEALCKDPATIQPKDSYAISTIMNRIKGWSKSLKSKRLKLYGKQRIYTKDN